MCLKLYMFMSFVEDCSPVSGETSQIMYHPSPASQPSRTLERWEDKHVRLLIESYQKFKDLMGKANITKKSVFDKIAKEFNKHSDLRVTGEQCLRKWKKLETKQKETEDNRQTGRATQTWKFHKEMEECIGSNANVTPVFTFDTGSSSSSSALSGSSQMDDDDDGSDDNASGSVDSRDKGKMVLSSNAGERKSVKRKRKSRSSASEMLQFLKEYGEKREKVEEEKISLLRAMQKEKNDFFGQLLSCLKEKK